MLKSKYYKYLDTLPLWNWHKINQSIERGEIELRWLMKFDRDAGFPTEYDRSELAEIYTNLVQQMQRIDISLQQLWNDFLIKNMDLRIAIIENENRRINGETEIKLNHDKAQRALNSYLKEVEYKYTDFEIPKYSFPDNLAEKWSEYFKTQIPSWAKDLTGLSFHSFAQYRAKIHKSRFEKFLLSEDFLSEFLKVEMIQIESLVSYNNLLFNSLYGFYGIWYEHREKELHHSALTSKIKTESDPIKAVMHVNKILGSNYSAKEISVLEFEKAAELAEETLKKQKNGRV